MKKVLVTGGSRGIGFEIVNEFLESGNFEIFSLSRNTTDKLPSSVKQIVYDLSDTKSLRSIHEITGYIDILINNAGILNVLDFENYPEEARDKLLNVNLIAPTELIKLYAPSMTLRNGGRVVNIASIAGQFGHPDVWYGISKAGVINMTKSLAKVYGGKGIVINCICPGPVQTDMGNMVPGYRKDFVEERSILHRFALPREVAKCAYWLATDSPEYVNGTSLNVSNGVYIN